VGFKRIRLAAGASATLHFTLQPRQFALADAEGRWVIEPGRFLLTVGGGQPGTPGTLEKGIDMVADVVVLED
jgi:beta-glucosidase